MSCSPPSSGPLLRLAHVPPTLAFITRSAAQRPRSSRHRILLPHPRGLDQREHRHGFLPAAHRPEEDVRGEHAASGPARSTMRSRTRTAMTKRKDPRSQDPRTQQRHQMRTRARAASGLRESSQDVAHRRSGGSRTRTTISDATTLRRDLRAARQTSWRPSLATRARRIRSRARSSTTRSTVEPFGRVDSAPTGPPARSGLRA